MDYLSKSYRLDTEVVEWLDGLKSDYGSVNKGLRAAMATCELSKGVIPLPVIDGLVNHGWGNQDPAIPLAGQLHKRFSEQLDNRPKNCFCKHCGQRFAGPKYSNICGDCKSSGHTLMPAECPRCTEASAL